MGLHIRDDFKSGAPISQVPASWFNRVARFINGLVPGDGISFEKSDEGPTEIRATGSGSGTVKSVDGHDPDENGAVSFGLTADRVVTTDSSGHLASANALTADRHVVTDANGALSTLSSSGVTSASGGGLEVITAVTWNASLHKLTVTKRKLVFEKGIVTSTGTATTSDVDVATLVTWA